MDIPGIELVQDLGERFTRQGWELSLTGGAIRDFLLGRASHDFDLVTNARPNASLDILRGWAGSAHRVANPFGVVECTVHGLVIQVATYQAPVWPQLPATIGALHRHLSSCDVTINTIALRISELDVVDPFLGMRDIADRQLRAPISGRGTVRIWPPNILRVVRFATELDFAISAELMEAMIEHAHHLARVDPGEFETSLRMILDSPGKARGIALMETVGVLPHLPERWRQAIAHHNPVTITD